MARSNWAGSGGWGTINDPTGQLNGRVLVAQAGITAINEDYLLQIVGTTLAGTTFSYAHYEVSCNYAWSAGAQNTIFSGGILGLLARAGNYSSASGVSLAQDAYIARLNYQASKAQIIKRKDGEEEILQEADIPSTANSFGVRHSASFVCRGTDPCTLQFYIDGNLAVNIGDNTTTIITSGDSGIQIGNGTTYIDNYAVEAYGVSTGGGGYSGATPDEFYADTTGASDTYMLLWFKSDAGVTTNAGGTAVTAWADQAGLIAGYSLAVPSSDSSPLLGTSLNGTKSISFDHSKHMSLKGDDDSALNINGTASNRIAVTFVLRFKNNNIGDQQNVSDVTKISPLLNYGRSYQFRMKWDIVDDNPDRQMQFDNNSSAPTAEPMFDVGDWVIVSANSGLSTDTDNRGFYKNGTQIADSNFAPSNADMTHDNLCLFMGRRYFGNSDADYQYGSFEIAEVILAREGTSGMGQTIRQKTEGYLAHKWGLTDLLPSDHPYKNASP